MADWDINRPIGKCSGSGKDIEPGEEYFASLVYTDEGLERRDYCSEYWNEHSPDVYCFWKSKFPHPEQKKKMFVDDDMLMAFFERLEEESDQQKINFRFVLAMILMRKKKLKYESSKKDGDTEIWKLRVTGSKEYTEIVNCRLNDKQIEELTCELGSVLHTEL
jgi:hypothetical protein